MKEKLAAHAIILAGGRGTRFWPRSRSRAPKQLLNIVGARTMLEQTVARLAPLFPAERTWVVTNQEQAAEVRRQLSRLPASHILAEPLGRNTAAAIGLAAFHLAHVHDDALMAVLPADHFIADAARYRKIVSAALQVAETPGNLVVLGIPPAHPERGFGYIERGEVERRIHGAPVYSVRRFTEKPSYARALVYLATRRYYWNAGMFFWRVTTFLDNLRKLLPRTYGDLAQLSAAIGSSKYRKTLARIYPEMENISVDYAIMEPATRRRGDPRVFVLPAEVGWSDIGSWAAVYGLEARKAGDNVSAGTVIALDASGNYFWTPEKLIAAIGVRDLVVVETPDALLICPRNRAQDVGQIVKRLESQKLRHLL